MQYCLQILHNNYFLVKQSTGTTNLNCYYATLGLVVTKEVHSLRWTVLKLR